MDADALACLNKRNSAGETPAAGGLEAPAAGAAGAVGAAAAEAALEAAAAERTSLIKFMKAGAGESSLGRPFISCSFMLCSFDCF